MSCAALERLLEFELENKNRKAMVRFLEARMEAAEAALDVEAGDYHGRSRSPSVDEGDTLARHGLSTASRVSARMVRTHPLRMGVLPPTDCRQ